MNFIYLWNLKSSENLWIYFELFLILLPSVIANKRDSVYYLIFWFPVLLMIMIIYFESKFLILNSSKKSESIESAYKERIVFLFLIWKKLLIKNLIYIYSIKIFNCLNAVDFQLDFYLDVFINVDLKNFFWTWFFFIFKVLKILNIS